jgi:hypothetical protein
VVDITKDRLQQVDMILVRDLFGHFSDVDLKLAIDNIKRSGEQVFAGYNLSEHL